MKKYLMAIYSITFVFLFIGCGKKDNASVVKPEETPVVIQETTKFTAAEIDAAMECVREEFKNFAGCELTDLWYDEKESNAILESYMKHGGGSKNGVDEKNVVVLLSNFDVAESGADGSFEAGTTYDDWNWILIRNGETDSWKVDDWGY